MPKASDPPEYRCAACGKLIMLADGLTGVVNVSCHSCKAITAIVDGVAQPLRPEYEAVVGHSIAPSTPLTPRDLKAMETRWKQTVAEYIRRKPMTAVGLRFRVFQRDGFRCVYCGRSSADGALLEADHVHPKSKGGEDSMENLVTACAECNRGKSDRVLTG